MSYDLDEAEIVISSDSSDHSCDYCRGEESWVKFCDMDKCKNFVPKKIYEQLAINYFDYKLETDTVFDLVKEADEYNPPLFDRLLWQHDEPDYNIEERVRSKISEIKESLFSFSGTFMLKYLLILVKEGLISVPIQVKIEREIRDTYKYNILRYQFIEMCHEGQNRYATQKLKVNKDTEFAQTMKKRRIESRD